MRFAERSMACVVLLSSVLAWAGPVLPYQGRLDRAGKPLTGTYNLQFSLYDAPAAGNLLWQDTFDNVTVAAGAFSVKLGSGVAIDASVLRNASVYLAIAVEGPGEASFTALAGRQQLLTAPYASASQQDFTVSGNLTVSNRADGGAGFSMTGDGGTATLRLSGGGQTLVVDSQSVTSSTTLGVQPNGQATQFGGPVNVNGNVAVNGAVSANNLGVKIFDSAFTAPPVSFNITSASGSSHVYQVFIDGYAAASASDDVLELRANGATSGYGSELQYLGGAGGYIGKTDGVILMFNPDRVVESFNTTLTVTTTINPVSFACTSVNVAGRYAMTEFAGTFWYGSTGGGICIASPSTISISIVNSGANSPWTIHVVVYQLD